MVGSVFGGLRQKNSSEWKSGLADSPLRSDKNSEEYDLWRVTGDGGTPQKLGLRMNDLAGLTMHPDDQQIMFVAGTRGQREIWVMENFLPKQNGKEQSRSRR